MDLFVYRLFSEIANQQNLTKVSEQFYITPSAVSHAIKILEKDFGVTLFDRNKRGTFLTESGKELLPYIQNILIQEENIREHCAMLQGLDIGRIHIGVPETICKLWFPDILKSFSQKYPNIEVFVQQSSYKPLEKMLLDNLLDMAIISIPHSEYISTSPLFRDRFFCVTPSTFVPANGEFVSNDELSKMTFIFPQRAQDVMLSDFVAQYHLKQDVRYNISYDNVVLAMVSKGLGCTITTELILKTNPGSYRIYPLENDISRPITLAFPSSRSTSIACQKFAEEVRKHVSILR